MAAGAFGQQVSVLFMGEGRGYLDAEITPEGEQTDLRKLLKSSPSTTLMMFMCWQMKTQIPRRRSPFPLRSSPLTMRPD